jgi:NAD(P)H-hydrate epimerase
MDHVAVSEFGLCTLVLMENAGRRCAEVLLEQDATPGRVVVLCGKGNNGGDGMVMARHLDAAGVDVRVITWWDVDSMSVDAATNARILQRAGIPYHLLDADTSVQQLAEQLSDAKWVVDGMLGIGTTGPPRPPISTALNCLVEFGGMHFCIDWPSGVCCETGAVCSPHPFRADVTCTLVAEKRHHHLIGPFCGKTVIADIGLPRALLRQFCKTHEDGPT